MDIKNKFSKGKIDHSNVRLNKLIRIKQGIRNKTKKIIPLTKMEEFLYDPSNMIIDRHQDMPLKGKYIRLDNILLLNIISKSDCDNLFAGIINIYKDNYLDGYLGGELRNKDIKKCIDSYKHSDNSNSNSRLCAITPQNIELRKLCDYIDIFIFELSNETIGIIFEMNMTNYFNDCINQIFNNKISSEINYEKYIYKKKWSYSKYTKSKNTERNSAYEDFIIETKVRFNKLFKKYLPLQLEYNDYPPISLNLYQTNYDTNNCFFKSLDLLKECYNQKCENIDVTVRDTIKEESDKTMKTTMFYEQSIDYQFIDRSNNIFFVIEKKTDLIINSNSSYINFCLISLLHFISDEMKKDISLENTKLKNCSYKKLNKNFEQHLKLKSKISFLLSLSNNLKINRFSYKDEYIEKGLSYIQEILNDCESQYKSIEEEYNFRINNNNTKWTFILSVITVIVSIFALVIGIYSSCSVNKNENNKNNLENSQNNVSEN